MFCNLGMLFILGLNDVNSAYKVFHTHNFLSICPMWKWTSPLISWGETCRFYSLNITTHQFLPELYWINADELGARTYCAGGCDLWTLFSRNISLLLHVCFKILYGFILFSFYFTFVRCALDWHLLSQKSSSCSELFIQWTFLYVFILQTFFSIIVQHYFL